jgi:hypothetical protein
VLNDAQRWSPAAIAQEIDSGVTETVLLQTPLTVMLLYWTVAFDDAGKPISSRTSTTGMPQSCARWKRRFDSNRRARSRRSRRRSIEADTWPWSSF